MQASINSTAGPVRPLFLALSADTTSELSLMVAKFLSHFKSSPLNAETICKTACFEDAGNKERLVIVGKDVHEISKLLEMVKSGESPDEVFRGTLTSSQPPPKIAFLFTGQGSQYLSMSRELYSTQSIFKKAMDDCEFLLKTHLKEPLLSVLFMNDANLLDQTEYTQPALFALEYSLSKLWQSWGIEPSAVIGHSVGEYPAACISGVLTLEDGLRLIATRARLMQALPSGGEMCSIGASESEISTVIAEQGNELSIAAINGLESTVIAGKRESVRLVMKHFEDLGAPVKLLTVSHAFHSPLMTPMLEEFTKVASQIKYSQPKIPIVSNLFGRIVDIEIGQADYWRAHVREPVRFFQGMRVLFELGYRNFLEVGPGATMCVMGEGCLPEGENEDDYIWNASLRKGRSDCDQISRTVAKLYIAGAEINWNAWHA
jgi:acyl transferase domain-containing protein